NPQAGWEVPYEDMDVAQPKDSCVLLYWAEQKLNRGDTRHVGFTYGLSSLGSMEGSESLALSVPAVAYENTEFTVTAYVYDSRKGQKVKLVLPEGMSLAAGESADKVVGETAKRTTVYWKVRAGKVGKFKVKARSERSGAVIDMAVKGKSIFG